MSVDKLAVIVITDGLRRDSIEAQSTPALDVLRGESVWLRRHRSAAPSVTRVCSATIATGCYPLRHELAGNKLCLLDHGKLRLLDVGVPSFFSLCRELRGHVLGVPTLAQRTEAAGGLRMYGNASPGAAYGSGSDAPRTCLSPSRKLRSARATPAIRSTQCELGSRRRPRNDRAFHRRPRKPIGRREPPLAGASRHDAAPLPIGFARALGSTAANR